jgi:hypothetical protein
MIWIMSKPCDKVTDAVSNLMLSSLIFSMKIGYFDMSMRRSVVIALLLESFACACCFGQQRIVKMPFPVNRPSVNNSSPFISLEGRSLLFLSDNTEDNFPTVFYTATADGANWKEPLLLSKSINSKLNYLRGFSLSADGKQMYISSTKGGGLGGYDLYVSNLMGAYWSEPVNVGQPINTKGNEACASMSTDGLQMYFMRCEKMDGQKAAGCKIWTATRRLLTSPWNAPVELPGIINSGNSQSPRIMGDGETLIFSSDKLPGKGGMDLFLSRRQGETWTQPVPLDFINTPGDNQFVSATSTGRYIMTEQAGKMETDLVELLFPPELKPKGVMKLEGTVSGLPTPGAAYVSLFDRDSDAKLGSARPDKQGVFSVYLKEGMRYSLSVDPEQDTYTFFTKVYDLTTGRVNTMDRVDAPLKVATPGVEIPLEEVTFKPRSAELEQSSKRQLGRVLRLMKSPAATHYGIEVSLYGYQRDSVQSSPELTEIRYDTAHYAVTTSVIDSAGVSTQSTRDSIVVKTSYHNDRTVQQALEIVNYLIEQGVPSGAMSPSSRVYDAVPEERKIVVKLKVL